MVISARAIRLHVECDGRMGVTYIDAKVSSNGRAEDVRFLLESGAS